MMQGNTKGSSLEKVFISILVDSGVLQGKKWDVLGIPLFQEEKKNNRMSEVSQVEVKINKEEHSQREVLQKLKLT